MKKSFLYGLLACFVDLAYAFEDPTVAVSAAQYHRRIQQTHVPDTNSTLDILLLLGKAGRLAYTQRWDEAVSAYEAVIGSGEDKASIWLRLSRAWLAKGQDERSEERALQAAYNAYRAAQNPDERARALFQLGTVYEQRGQSRRALAAYEEGLALKDEPAFAERYRKLKDMHAFRLENVDVEANSATPRVCLTFSKDLQNRRQVDYADYLHIWPPIDPFFRVRGRALCVGGIDHGQDYKLTVRPGLPAASGEKIDTAEHVSVRISDREPRVEFGDEAYLLPRLGNQELPLTSVNVETVRIRILYINDRNLVQQVNEGRIATDLDEQDIERIAERAGELVWRGEIGIQTKPNREVITAIPIGKILQDTWPGVYVVTAEPVYTGAHPARATQWLVMSDLGISTFSGEDGLHVFVRSLETGRPQRSVLLRLYARNNRELGRAITDRDGYARFSPDLSNGLGGRAPAVLMAYTRRGDFNFLDLTQPAFDLGDRGAEGREIPGPVDVFLYTDRGVYRPGETVKLVGLVRDKLGYALAQEPRLTVRLVRPDGVQDRRIGPTGSQGGGYQLNLLLADDVLNGIWKIRAYADPEADPIGEASFRVEDLSPPRLKLELNTRSEILMPGKTVEVEVEGRFPDGVPAAYLRAEAELVLQADPKPYPGYSEYRFGLSEEPWSAESYPLPVGDTDADGRTRMAVRLTEFPDIARPLIGIIRVSLFDQEGRPVTQSLNLPFRPEPFAIGLRLKNNAWKVGGEGVFDVIAVDREGKRLAVEGVRYELSKELSGHHPVGDEPLDEGLLTLSAEQINTLILNGLEEGPYRLEIYDPQTGTASDIRFRIGDVALGNGKAPVRLPVTLYRDRYRIGDMARVRIGAPFAGEALLTVADVRLKLTRTFFLPERETTFRLRVTRSWQPGVYVTVTAFRAARDSPQGAWRAIGLAWLGFDPEPRTLGIEFALPEAAESGQTIEIPVTVADTDPADPTYLTLAAVDEEVLQSTDFQTPDPIDHYLGQPRLGIAIRDVYGELITPNQRLPERLQSEEDTGSRSPPKIDLDATPIVALFSGIVATDEDGKARISLHLPAFTGRLRLMAIAWNRNRLGGAESWLLVRDK